MCLKIEISDHMSGFLDVRHKEFGFNIFTSEIRQSMKLGRCFTPGNFDFAKCQTQLHAGGTVSVASETFNWSTKLNGLRDLLSVMTMYDSYLESQIKCNNNCCNYNFKFYIIFIK